MAAAEPVRSSRACVRASLVHRKGVREQPRGRRAPRSPRAGRGPAPRQPRVPAPGPAGQGAGAVLARRALALNCFGNSVVISEISWDIGDFAPQFPKGPNVSPRRSLPALALRPPTLEEGEGTNSCLWLAWTSFGPSEIGDV